MSKFDEVLRNTPCYQKMMENRRDDSVYEVDDSTLKAWYEQPTPEPLIAVEREWLERLLELSKQHGVNAKGKIRDEIEKRLKTKSGGNNEKENG